MEEYEVSNIDANVLATVNEELNKREEQQRRHYLYLQELQLLARELPSKYQQRLSSDLMVGLANSLLDGTVFQIVSHLSDLQRMDEENLFNSRNKLLAEFADEKQAMKAEHKERLYKCQAAKHNLPRVELQNKAESESFEKRKREKIIDYDKSIVDQLDLRLRDQQTMLAKARVAGFFCTTDPEDIRLQMYLLDFIARLSSSGI